MTKRRHIGCDVRSLSYDFETRSGTLIMGDGQCCDMSGCIALFQDIDPDVKRIATFENGNADTRYVLADGEWHSLEGSNA